MIQEHLQATYQYLFDTAHDALRYGPSFVPFGASIRVTGEQTHAKVDLAWDKSSPQDHITGLIAGFRQDEAGPGLIAAGLVFDTAPSDERLSERALCFHLEGANGRAIQVVVPYERQAENAIMFGDPQINQVPAEIFLNVTPD